MNKPNDTERINWLERQNARLQFVADDEASLPRAVVFLPTIHKTESDGVWEEFGSGDDFRAAIDDAMDNEREAYEDSSANALQP